MALEKVKPGDDFAITADDWNAIVEAVGITKVSGRGRAGRRIQLPRNTVTVLVQNVSGDDLEQFSAVGVVGVASEPDDDDANALATTEFVSRTILEVDTPTDEDVGKFLVLLAPLKDAEVGLAVSLGVVPCRINVGDAADTTVDVEDGQTVPASSLTGSAQIMWVAGGVGTATATGEQWAVIRIGGGAAAELPTPQYAKMVFQGVSQNQVGYDWIRSHTLIGD